MIYARLQAAITGRALRGRREARADVAMAAPLRVADDRQLTIAISDRTGFYVNERGELDLIDEAAAAVDLSEANRFGRDF